MSEVLSDELAWCATTVEFLATQGDIVTEDVLREFHALPDVPTGAEYHPELVYGTGSGRELTMLLYARADADERRPAILEFHGGGWRSGTKTAQRRQCAEFAALGYIAGSVEYRFSAEAPWPAHLEDAKCAVRYLRANHERFGVDPGRIVIAGGSAGAHLAAMVALTPGRLEGTGGHGDTSSEVQAALLFSPPVDLRLESFPQVLQPLVLELLGGDVSRCDEASPLLQITPDAPPIMTLSGDRDPAAMIEHIRDFHAALDAAGVTNELVEYPGRMHGFGIYGPDFFDVVRRTHDFLERHL